MCGYRHRSPAVDGPAEGATVRLSATAGEGRQRCGTHFPWWTLWMLWPLFWLIKGVAALASPVLAWLWQPLVVQITPLPILLVAAGISVLVISAVRRRREEQ